MLKKVYFFSAISIVLVGIFMLNKTQAATTVGANITSGGTLAVATSTVTGNLTVQDFNSSVNFLVNNNNGQVGIATSTPSAGYRLDIAPGTLSGINVGTVNSLNQRGVVTNVNVDNTAENMYYNTSPAGMYNTVILGTGISGFAIPNAIYNYVEVNTQFMGVAAFPAGIYNRLHANGFLSQIAGIKTDNSLTDSGEQYPTANYTTTDALYTALYGGGLNSTVRGERLEIFLDNDDGLAQTGYGTKMSIQNQGTGDSTYGFYVDDHNDVAGGTEYGIYLNLDDANANRYGIYEVGGAINYFNGKVGLATTTPGGWFGERLTIVGNTYTRGTATTTGDFIIGDGNSTATTTVEIGDIDTAACIKARDANADGWTYCYFEDGAIVCSTTNVCGK